MYAGPIMSCEEERSASIPFCLAARFSAERPAARAYVRARETVFKAPCDLSISRFLLNQVSHIAIIGEPPSATLERDLRRILSHGTPVRLPMEILAQLWARRLDAIREGDWVERHHRPTQSVGASPGRDLIQAAEPIAPAYLRETCHFPY